MRSLTLLALTTLFACSAGGDANKDDTDAVSDTDEGGGSGDTDVASDDTDSDTDEAGPVAWGEAAVGTWTPTADEAACGIDFTLGFVGAAVADQPNQFTLTMTESGSLQQMTFTCTFSDATTYACESEVVSNGDVTTCLYQSALGDIGGTVVGAVGTVSVTVGQNAVGQYCPPVPPCTGTATATATIAD
jgi:hypothetical protein